MSNNKTGYDEAVAIFVSDYIDFVKHHIYNNDQYCSSSYCWANTSSIPM